MHVLENTKQDFIRKHILCQGTNPLFLRFFQETYQHKFTNMLIIMLIKLQNHNKIHNMWIITCDCTFILFRLIWNEVSHIHRGRHKNG